MAAPPAVTSDPEVMMGKPCVAGTRLTVEFVVEQLAFGRTAEELAASYENLSEEGIAAALGFAAGALRSAGLAAGGWGPPDDDYDADDPVDAAERSGAAWMLRHLAPAVLAEPADRAASRAISPLAPAAAP